VIAMRGVQSKVILVALGIAVLVVLVGDLFAPLSIDLWLLYLPLCIATLWIVGPAPALASGAGFSVLIVAGLFLSTPDIAFGWAMFNRLLGIVSLWLMVFFIRVFLSRSEQLQEASTKLRESEERLKLALTAAKMGAWERDLESNKVFWSPETYQILGVEDFSGSLEAFTGLLHPEDAGRVLATVDRAVANRSLYQAEFRIVRPGGEVRWLSNFGRAEYDESGKPLRVIGTVQDITERKRAEEAVRDSESRFREMANTAPVMIWTSGVDRLCNYVNEHWLNFTGRTLEQELGNGWVDAVHPDDRECALEAYVRAFDVRRPFAMEYRLRRHDGEYRWMVDNGVPRHGSNGEFLGYIGSGIDITERKRAEEASRSLREMLEAIRHVQTRFIASNEAHDVFENLLETLLRFTGSEYGFIGEVLHQTDGQPYLKTHAITNIAWDEITKKFYEANAPRGLELDNLKTLFGAVMTTGAPVFANSPSTDPRRGGIPAGHPSLNAFLGLPLTLGDDMVGMVGLANRDGGYDNRLCEELEPLLSTCARLVDALRQRRGRQRAEDALRESEERLRLVLDTLPAAAYTCDADGSITYFNERASELWGRRPKLNDPGDRFCGSVRILDPDGSAIPHDQCWMAMALREKRSVDGKEAIVERSDGDQRYVLTHVSPLWDLSGSLVGAVNVLVDISDRKRVEVALRHARDELEEHVQERTAELTRINVLLRESEQRLQHALAVGGMGTWERELSTGAMRWDDRLYRMSGIEPGTPLDLTSLYSLIHPEDLPGVKKSTLLTETTGAAYQCDYRVIRPDGKTLWMHADGGLRRDRNGSPTHIAGISFDITQRKQTEETRRQLTAELDHRVAERTQELADSQARLRALVAELARAEERERRRLAIELHDYMAQMLLVSRLKLDRAGGLARSAELKELLADAQKSLDDSINYTRTLMAELSPRVLYDLGLPPALRWLAEQMARHGLNVEVSGETEGLSLPEDHAVFLFQCVRELLWNVVKHAGTNKASVSYYLEHGQLTVRVADQGKGFDPVVLPEIGNGLEKFGLFSMRERLELQGGLLEVISSPGKGTTVTMKFPVVKADLEKAMMALAKPESMPLSVGQPIRVVLVDDHQMMRQGLRSVLEDHRELAIVGEAADGLEAVAMAQRLAPDVVLMDINLPKLDGIAATQRIMQERPSTIVIGISFGSDAYVDRAMKAAGAITCVNKERAVEDIRRAILDAVEERKTILA
jgi:PAS domain S-box-containing protein